MNLIIKNKRVLHDIKKSITMVYCTNAFFSKIPKKIMCIFFY